MMHWALKQLGAVVGRGKLSILIYHQVMEETDPMRPSEPNAEQFEWQMRLLREHFQPLSLDDALDAMAEDRLPANAVCVTFDDGYKNNLNVAQPILEKYAIPATVYVATGFSHGVNMWNDRLIDLFAQRQLSSINLDALEQPPVMVDDWNSRREAAYALIPTIKYQDVGQRQRLLDQLYADNQAHVLAPKMMTPDEICSLRNKGVLIGAHTVDHPILKVQTDAEQHAQIVQSKSTLEDWLQSEVSGFAYPNGKPQTDYTDTSVALARSAGFRYAVSTQWGYSTCQTDPYQLNRFTPWDQQPGRFHARLVKNLLGGQ